MSDFAAKIHALAQFYEQPADFQRVLDKLLMGALAQQRLTLARYDRDLREFENRFHLPSSEFYARFESGALGDTMDYFEWAGLWELRQKLAHKIEQTEQAL